MKIALQIGLNDLDDSFPGRYRQLDQSGLWLQEPFQETGGITFSENCRRGT